MSRQFGRTPPTESGQSIHPGASGSSDRRHGWNGKVAHCDLRRPPFAPGSNGSAPARSLGSRAPQGHPTDSGLPYRLPGGPNCSPVRSATSRRAKSELHAKRELDLPAGGSHEDPANSTEVPTPVDGPRIAEVGSVDDVEQVGPELHPHPLAEIEPLVGGDVEAKETRAAAKGSRRRSKDSHSGTLEGRGVEVLAEKLGPRPTSRQTVLAY